MSSQLWTCLCCSVVNKLQLMPNALRYAPSESRGSLETPRFRGKVSFGQTKTTSYSCTNVMQACVQQVHWLHKLKTKHLFLPLIFFFFLLPSKQIYTVTCLGLRLTAFRLCPGNDHSPFTLIKWKMLCLSHVFLSLYCLQSYIKSVTAVSREKKRPLLHEESKAGNSP